MTSSAQPLNWRLGPLEVMGYWPADLPLLMLHSGRFDATWSRHSILASPSGAYRFSLDESGAGRSKWLGEAPPGGMPGWTHRPFTDLRAALHRDPHCLWVGHLSYDVARFLERLPSHAAADRAWPVIQMHRCPGWLVYDATAQQWHGCGSWAWNGPQALVPAPRRMTFQAGEPASPDDPRRYADRVQCVKDYIAAGDAFQVNLAQRFTADFTGSPRALFDALASGSPAWYGAHLELFREANEPRRALCSTSPELFLAVDQAGRVTTRPIKGTRPAAADPAELAHSEKDAAELHMIVDLLRNDLGRVCDYGSVRVTQPRTIESHPTVHHGVATVEGRLHASKDLIDLLKATMPGGSITGAPKVRAMQIVDELEPVRRGPYCGAIGYIHGFGADHATAQLNIAIRTLMVETDARNRGRADFAVGGGIVADSDPASEYQETLDKARAMTEALRAGRAH